MIRRVLTALALVTGVLTFVAPAAQAAKNCMTADFPNQAAAQAYLGADPSDPEGLDGPPGSGQAGTGEYGVACESLPCPCDRANVDAAQSANANAAAAPNVIAASSDGSITVTFEAPLTTATVPRATTRRASRTVANTGPRDYVGVVAALGVALGIGGRPMRGRRALGAHFL
jgi:hypothetical protein